MDSQLSADSGDEMCADDVFEGWLSFPMGIFIEHQPQSRPSQSTFSNSKSRMQEDVGKDPMRLGVGPGENSQSDRSYPFGGNCESSSFSLSPQPLHNASAVNSAMRKRRVHTKSRLGCMSCKKRRKKVSCLSGEWHEY